MPTRCACSLSFTSCSVVRWMSLHSSCGARRQASGCVLTHTRQGLRSCDNSDDGNQQSGTPQTIRRRGQRADWALALPEPRPRLAGLEGLLVRGPDAWTMVGPARAAREPLQQSAAAGADVRVPLRASLAPEALRWHGLAVKLPCELYTRQPWWPSDTECQEHAVSCLKPWRALSHWGTASECWLTRVGRHHSVALILKLARLGRVTRSYQSHHHINVIKQPDPHRHALAQWPQKQVSVEGHTSHVLVLLKDTSAAVESTLIELIDKMPFVISCAH